MGALQVITAILSLVYLSRINRRTLILVGNFGMSICCLGIGVCFLLINNYKQMFYIVVTLIIIFMGLNGATLLPAIPMYIPEVGNKQ